MSQKYSVDISQNITWNITGYTSKATGRGLMYHFGNRMIQIAVITIIPIERPVRMIQDVVIQWIWKAWIRIGMQIRMIGPP